VFELLLTSSAMYHEKSVLLSLLRKLFLMATMSHTNFIFDEGFWGT